MAERKDNLPDNAVWFATYNTSDGEHERNNESLYYLPDSRSFVIDYEYDDSNPDFPRHEKGVNPVSLNSAFEFYQNAASDSSEYLTSKRASRDPDALYIMGVTMATLVADKLESLVEYTPIGSISKMRHDEKGCTHIRNQQLGYAPKSREFIKAEYPEVNINDPDMTRELWEKSRTPISEGVIPNEEALSFIDDPDFKLTEDSSGKFLHIDIASRATEIIEDLRREVENERSDAERKENTMPEQTKRDIRIKDPDAPASGAQMGLLNALAENGVVTPEELAALGDSPTKQAASDLISAHAEDEGFKAVQEARRAQRAAAKPQREDAPKEQNAGKNAYAHVKMPAAFITPHTYTAKDGREFEKAYVHFPPNTKINGIDISGYSCDVFLNDYMKNQMLAGEQVTLSFKADEKVDIWTGRKDDPLHPYDRKEVNPYLLTSAIKTANEGFREAKATERAAVKQEAKEEKAAGVTMKGMAVETRASSAALEGHDQPDAPANTR